MIRTPFYFFLHYKYEIFDQKNFSYIKNEFQKSHI